MERGAGKKAAETLGVHPSTVSRNKERTDVAAAAQTAGCEIRANLQLNQLNGNGRVERPDGGSIGDAGGQ